uniref:Uncharacterized protein n=1 Tax=Anguilla anguilla TaxID=7936 RepID=A0A0E9VM04_ANGAN
MLYILSNFGPWLLVICSVLQMKHLVHTHLFYVLVNRTAHILNWIYFLIN